MQNQCKAWRHELSNLRIQRLELEQQDPQHEGLQAVEAAIAMRERQLNMAQAGESCSRPKHGRWQVRVVAKAGGRTVDWSMMNGPQIDPVTNDFVPAGEGWLAWRKLFEDVQYIASPVGKPFAWAVARDEPKTLAQWQELFASVDQDVEDMDQDVNVVQEAGVMIDNGRRVIEVGALGEDMQRDPGKRARCTLAEQRRVLGRKRWCGHVHGSVLRECCKVRACGCKDGSERRDCCV